MKSELDRKYQDIINDTPGLLQVTWEWKQWLHKLEHEIKPKTYVEIGNEYGAALATINKVLPHARLIGIDLKPPHMADSNPVDPPDKHERCYEFIQGNTHDLETWKKLWLRLNGERADVLFIDGAHHLDDVYRDWTDYGPLARIVALEIVATEDKRSGPDKWGGIGIVYLEHKLGNHPLSTDI